MPNDPSIENARISKAMTATTPRAKIPARGTYHDGRRRAEATMVPMMNASITTGTPITHTPMPIGMATSLQLRAPQESVTIGNITDMTSSPSPTATRRSVKMMDRAMSSPRFLMCNAFFEGGGEATATVVERYRNIGRSSSSSPMFRSTTTGTWSLGPSPFRSSRAMCASATSSAKAGFARMKSMRIPSFFGKRSCL